MTLSMGEKQHLNLANFLDRLKNLEVPIWVKSVDRN